jgi:Fic family protein
MKPPYEITTEILRKITSISEKIGEIKASYLDKQNPQLRKQNKIKTIHSSLKIEGNTLCEQQVKSILENKRVVGPQKDILEVVNAIQVYDRLSTFGARKEKDFLLAHSFLMKDLVPDAGSYRRQSVGIAKGGQVTHIAPSFQNVPFLMKELFDYLNDANELTLIKGCVFHYEMEFIHPFIDGNGRMGRLWQTIILMKKYPIFEFLPFETLISLEQDKYYKALSDSDHQRKSTVFIEYMLGLIDTALGLLIHDSPRTLSDVDRIKYFISQQQREFTRKDYMRLFKEISPATASRDLRKAVELGLLFKKGDKKTTAYKVVEI